MTKSKVGDIQIDDDGSEWVVIGITHSSVSRMQRNSLAHKVHAQSSPDIAKSYIPVTETSKE